MSQDALGRSAVALAVTCVLLVGATFFALLTPSIRTTLGLTPRVSPAYARGDRIDVPPSIYESSAFTVVLFARSDCGVCQRVKPWLSEMRAAVEARPAVQVVMVAINARLDDEVEFAREIGLGRERVFPLTPQGLKARLTPTLVLVDRQGTVLFSIDGAAPDQTAGAIPTIVNLTQSR